MHYVVFNMSDASLCSIPLLSPEQLDDTEYRAYMTRGESYLRMRTLLHRELARRTGSHRPHTQLSYTQQGKPICEEQPFNLSHSGEYFCIAFHHSPIGVDIERIRPRRHLRAVAERVFCPEQITLWHERGCSAAEFYDCWCAAEALAKLRSDSILHTRPYPFVWTDGRIQTLFEPAPVIRLFRPAAGYTGAAAYIP